MIPSQRRLQRGPDFSGERLIRFRQVVLRHGLPGALLGAICFLVPEIREFGAQALAAFLQHSHLYVIAAMCAFAAMLVYTRLLAGELGALNCLWIVYLLALSAWEEWVFRLAVPYFGAALGADFLLMVVCSNLVFAVMHFFTLRWKWQWCVLAFVGGLAFSRFLHTHNDLALLVGIHWLSTFINTPRPPGGR